MDLKVFRRYHNILNYLKFPESESMDEVMVKKLLTPPLRQECFYKWVISEMGEQKLTLRKFLVDNGICLPCEYSLFLSTEKLSMERQFDILNKTFTDLLIKHNTSSYTIAALVPDLLPRTLLLTRRLHQLKVETDQLSAENKKLKDCYDSLRTLPEEFETASFDGAIMNMHTKSSLFEDFFSIMDCMVELSVENLSDMEPDSYDEIDDLLPELFRVVVEYQHFLKQTKDKIRFWTQNNVPKNYALDDELLLKLTELNL